MKQISTHTHAMVPEAGTALKSASAEEREMLSELAQEILAETRVVLMMQYRFMDAALWCMDFEEAPCALALASNGKKTFFNAVEVIRRFSESSTELARDYLHLLLHCIFRHPLEQSAFSPYAWNIACDVIVEAVAMEMAGQRFTSLADADRTAQLAFLEDCLGKPLTPHKIARAIEQSQEGVGEHQEKGLNLGRIWDLQLLFARDSHESWVSSADGADKQCENPNAIHKQDLSQDKRESEEESSSGENETQLEEDTGELEQLGGSQAEETAEGTQGEISENDGSGKEPEEAAGEQDKTAVLQESIDNQADSDQSDSSQNNSPQDDEGSHQDTNNQPANSQDRQQESLQENSTLESQQDYDQQQQQNSLQEQVQERNNDDYQQHREDLEEQLQKWREIALEMQTHLESFSQEQSSQKLMASLEVANAVHADYADFLKRFARLGEDMVVNDDEFDYIYYTFGLNTYGNMPLVEPLEYKESHRVREFVIALDTSGSCSGELIKRFVARTYDILRETEGFGEKINLHIIQCDNHVRSDIKISHIEELERELKEFKVYGFGGTDFRPLFEYVDSLLEAGEFEDLRGLIYFTDGLGYFPVKPPEYETAFVFLTEGMARMKVPPWAMKVVLNEEGIREL